MNKNLISHPAINSFKNSSEKYCKLIEGINSYSPYEIFQECAKIFPILYSEALALPEIEIKGDKDEVDEIDHEKWNLIYLNISNIFGKYNLYTDVHDPIHPDKDEPTMASLADDLSDIYRDLKNGLLKLNNNYNSKIESVVWDWKFNFQTHWGIHLASALKAIHFLIFDHMEKDYKNQNAG